MYRFSLVLGILAAFISLAQESGAASTLTWNLNTGLTNDVGNMHTVTYGASDYVIARIVGDELYVYAPWGSSGTKSWKLLYTSTVEGFNVDIDSADIAANDDGEVCILFTTIGTEDHSTTPGTGLPACSRFLAFDPGDIETTDPAFEEGDSEVVELPFHLDCDPSSKTSWLYNSSLDQNYKVQEWNNSSGYHGYWDGAGGASTRLSSHRTAMNAAVTNRTDGSSNEVWCFAVSSSWCYFADPVYGTIHNYVASYYEYNTGDTVPDDGVFLSSISIHENWGNETPEARVPIGIDGAGESSAVAYSSTEALGNRNDYVAVFDDAIRTTSDATAVWDYSSAGHDARIAMANNGSSERIFVPMDGTSDSIDVYASPFSDTSTPTSHSVSVMSLTVKPAAAYDSSAGTYIFHWINGGYAYEYDLTTQSSTKYIGGFGYTYIDGGKNLALAPDNSRAYFPVERAKHGKFYKHLANGS